MKSSLGTSLGVWRCGQVTEVVRNLSIAKLWVLLMALVIWNLCAIAAPASVRTVLYSTGFDTFASGVDKLVESDKWLGSTSSKGVHGVDAEGSGGIGQSGYIGRNRPAPSVTFVSVRNAVDYDPFAAAETRGEVMEFFGLIGVADSTNGKRDNFYVTVYDSENRLLGAVNFDNTQERFGIYKYDGSNYERSPVGFVRGRWYELFIRVNFATGRWSAELNHLPIFEDALIDFTGKSRQLGAVAVEWEISDVSKPGNNWMLFDEWLIQVATTPPPVPTLSVGSNLSITWASEAGYFYELQSSGDLISWSAVSEQMETKPAAETGVQTVRLPLPEAKSQSSFFKVVRSPPSR